MQTNNEKGRKALEEWQKSIRVNPYQNDPDFKQSVALYLNAKIGDELQDFADRVVKELEPLVSENNLDGNLPQFAPYDGIGNRIDEIIHHPSYEAAGNIIYSSKILERMAKPGGLLEALAFMFLSSQAGEAGHNCPVACSAGIIRVLQKTTDFPLKNHFIKKLIDPSYSTNFTGAQFLTEIQGGSDVGMNATEAFQENDGSWRIQGEKWFCSNADAELILLTARYDQKIPGTKGLGLFLVPKRLESGEHNHFTIKRLKEKIGTRSMASAEIDFKNAYAIAIGDPKDGFKLIMENVLHISRLFNTFCVLGMGRRAFHIALSYAKHRAAFDHPIIEYPLVKENLARIKAESDALLASIFATSAIQDEFDQGKLQGDEPKLLLRLLANLNKYLSALWSVDHIHHALDVLAGNGAIESFSTIPRLFRDSIVCENWEGTHNTLRIQILKDIGKYQIDQILLTYLEMKLHALKSVQQVKIIKEGIEKLKKELSLLKSVDAELQSFQIKPIVNQMAILFASVQLLNEAEKGSPSKMKSLNYFLRLNLTQDLSYDQEHLKLIKEIIYQ